MTTGNHNLAALADDALERHGDRESLYYEGDWFRSAALHDRAMRVSRGLVELGVEPGDRVSVVMANCPEVGISYQAVWRAGGVTNPIIFLLPPHELAHIFRDAEVRAVITTPEFVPNVQAAIKQIDLDPVVICVGEAPEGVVPYSQLEDSEPGELVPREDTALATLMYTGGTTGRAKGVPLTHDNLWFCGAQAEEVTRLEDDQPSNTLVPLPLSHAYGQIVTVIGMHAKTPGTAALMRWFDPSGSLQLIEDLRLNRATVVPSMLQLWLGQGLEERDLESLRYVSCGASPLSIDVAEEFMRLVPSAEILEGYGCTESAGVISANAPGEARLGSVGRPLPGYDVRIRDEDGNDLPVGEAAEIVVRSRGCASEYWNAPEDSSSTFRDGWLHTGDVGRFDEDGFLYVVDRMKDLIIRNGFNVYPRDVEDALLDQPGVALAGVVGRPDAEVGEEIVAFVSPAAGFELDPEQLQAAARERLGPYKYPREVKIVEQVPLTPVMKIDRKALRAML
ncbi:MAG: AMP-binding protein [Nitriliruptorales bacterium]|nr:AMP-binding protein [Nitriliruptorales bacterium]